MKKFIIMTISLFVLLTTFAMIRGKGFFDGQTVTYSNMTREKFVRKVPIKATLVITYDENRSATYKTTADDGDSVYNLIRTVTAKEGIDFVEDEGGNPKVTSIGGVENTDMSSWYYVVNLNTSDLPSDEYIFSDGDTIEFIYE